MTHLNELNASNSHVAKRQITVKFKKIKLIKSKTFCGKIDALHLRFLKMYQLSTDPNTPKHLVERGNYINSAKHEINSFFIEMIKLKYL